MNLRARSRHDGRQGGREGLGPQHGQVLVLFAIAIFALLGVSALAIDVSRAYASLRFYRSVADSASLAGAQDLQTPGTRNIPGGAYTAARQRALDSLVSQLGSGSPSCSPAADIVNCALPGTPYTVSIKTPSPTCVSCDPERSVQVSVRNSTFRVTIGAIFGDDQWSLGVTSVAGLNHRAQYAIATLRPPKKLGATFDVNDIIVSGTGTTVTVKNGDVGVNANAILNGVGAEINLDPGFKVYIWDWPADWVGPPPSKRLKTPIPDPNYRYPSFAGAPTYPDASTSPARTRADDLDGVCAAEALKLDVAVYTFMDPITTPLDKIYCYNPGIYDSNNNNARIVVANGEVALLKPGVYYLKKGLDVSGRIVGGYEPASKGVALVFDECSNVQCNFSGNTAPAIALNVGTRFPPGSPGTIAAPAVDFAGVPVVTSGPMSPKPAVLLTLLVKKDPDCFVPTAGAFLEPPGCDANKNKTINMAGGGSLAVAGVQYLPTDNASINGGSAGTGSLGQIIAWTLTYTGGTHINQEYAGNDGNAVLRIDAACSGAGTPCNP